MAKKTDEPTYEQARDELASVVDRPRGRRTHPRGVAGPVGARRGARADLPELARRRARQRLDAAGRRDARVAGQPAPSVGLSDAARIASSSHGAVPRHDGLHAVDRAHEGSTDPARSHCLPRRRPPMSALPAGSAVVGLLGEVARPTTPSTGSPGRTAPTASRSRCAARGHRPMSRWAPSGHWSDASPPAGPSVRRPGTSPGRRRAAATGAVSTTLTASG